jgi:hypothetical protein
LSFRTLSKVNKKDTLKNNYWEAMNAC